MGKSERRENGVKEKEVAEKDEEIYCGLGPFRPDCMQGCASMACVTVALALAGISTSTLSIYINSQITTLERQFGFSSSVSGALLSCNDFGYLLTTLLASYMARRVHIPRALSISTLLFGLSGILCTVPFFATKGDLPPAPHMNPGGRNINLTFDLDGQNSSSPLTSHKGPSAFDAVLCDVTSALMTLNSSLTLNSTGCDGEGRSRSSGAISDSGRTLAVTFIGVGMIFQGFGKSPRHPFIGTYVDDNVPKTKTTLYLGIITSCSIFGPVLAFTLGGVFSKIYLTLEETNMSPMDPRWVGAWWLGFLLFGLLAIFASVPTSFFPRRLRPQPQLRMLEQNRKQSSKGQQCCYDVKEFFKTIARLVRTPVYMCTILGSCISLFGIGGMVSFLPKYLETQFQIPAWKANIMLGVLNVLSAAGGTLGGGIVTSRFKLTPVKCLKLMVAVSGVSAMFAATGFFLGCEQPVISMGASSTHQHDVPIGNMTNALPASCPSTCHCGEHRFFPVCGVDGVTYFSPCHAGCTESLGMGYSSCSCVNFNNNATAAASPSADGPTTSSGFGPQVRPGICEPDCSSLIPYAMINFFGALFSTFVIMPSFIVSVRSVPEKDKPLAIGLSAFMTTLLGWFLGPIIYGRVIDTCCLLWSSGCDGSGSCVLYDIVEFRNRYHSLFFATRVGTCVTYAIALTIAVCVRVKFSPQADDNSAVIKPTTEDDVENIALNGDKVVTDSNKNGGKPGSDDEEERMLGGRRIYKGGDPL